MKQHYQFCASEKENLSVHISHRNSDIFMFYPIHASFPRALSVPERSL